MKFLEKLHSAILENKERNAFLFDEVFYTYSDLAECISRIRKSIQKEVPEEEKIIGLIALDDLETYAAIIALWFEGKAYVPLSPKNPADRNRNVISLAGIKTVLDSSDEPIFPECNVIQTKKLPDSDIDSAPKNVDGNELVYILFTSGTTGQPKGVPISRANLDSFIDAFLQVGFKINEQDKCLQSFDLTFDVSVQSFLVPLLHGACVFTVPINQIKYSYVYGLLVDHELTFGVFAPSMIRHLRPYFDEINLPKLRYCILTAEASPVDLVNEWMACIPNSEVFNFYGPTEATIYCTYYRVERTKPIKEANGMLCIGRPFNGITSLILNENLQKVNQGTKGEMYISGAQLTSGYWKNQERNKESFISLPHNGKNEIFYKTGDLCVEDIDGNLLYYGRLDYQVKIQGFRIELGEIEFHSRASIGGKNAIAFVYDGNGGNPEIALCFETATFDREAILNYLKSKLPPYMIPSKLFNLAEFPLNSSGKIDKNSIKHLLGL
ncbi:MAG TPA: amino acid adenylation domain-containing protein [Flavobacterium sp.]|uniref:amino acid adenylation domain-containing protein n=1 Tax=Flavobacterium sp. TaxID=239 RepID=UPI002C546F07|nr:amino acid adenylation domain-containing protein [Flavobacterium sp.]HNP33130.1 amino acid adenylation domain-containing protein [Flavobacterium sp.]